MAIDATAGDNVAAERRRRRPAWVPTIAAFATIALCLTAASWQHRRMLEKEALQQEISAAATAPALPLPPGATDWSRWRFRTVTLTRHALTNIEIIRLFVDVSIDVIDDGRDVVRVEVGAKG